MQARPSLIFLPGLDGTGKLLEPLLRQIPKHFQTQVVPYPPHGPQDPRGLAEAVAGAVRPQRPAVMIAESFGAPVAIELAAKHPDWFRSIILIGGFVVSPRSAALVRLAAWTIRWAPITSWAVRMLAAGWNADDEVVRLAKHAIGSTPRAILSARLRSLIGLDCRASLRAFPKPVLALVAEEDVIVPPRNAQFIISAGARVTVLPIRGPHMLLETRPVECWEVIEPFISEQASND